LKKKPSRKQALEAVRTLLSYIGEDVTREGLVKTPDRVIKAWEKDWGIGYNRKFIQAQTLSILGAKFDDGAENYNQMIMVRRISFVSHCEHHMAEFGGTVSVAYIPAETDPKILGLSKLVRVVDMFSRRLQVQERLTNQVADFLDIHCKPRGVGVVVRAKHSCICSRGVRQFDTEAVTSALRGEMLNEPIVREEFLSLVGR
jgi:GTP cyclohydrolase I